jgi:hypothetical protein
LETRFFLLMIATTSVATSLMSASLRAAKPI